MNSGEGNGDGMLVIT